MNTDAIVIILYIAGLMILTGVIMILNNRKLKTILLRRIKRLWGTEPERELTADELRQIGYYGNRRKKDCSFYIDDITWNDLNMNDIFQMINNTMSAPGEEYLYYLLRTPLLEERTLKERDRLMNFFKEKEEQRLKLQLLLAEIGKLRVTSVAKSLDNLKGAPKANQKVHLTALLLFCLSLLTVVYNPLLTFGLLLIVVTINAGTYYLGKDRKIVDIYLGCFQCILRMLSVGKSITKLNWEELKVQNEKLQASEQALKSFQRGSFLLSGKNSTAGGLEAVLLDFLRIVTHADLLMYNRMLLEVIRHEKAVEQLAEVIGELDALIAATSFRTLLGSYCLPTFSESSNLLHVEGLYHPLISHPVSNDIHTEGSILLTGSNASGKSTFLKNIAINSILAQSLYTCTARTYKASMFRIMTSMTLADNLAGGESYFIVELKSLLRIIREMKNKESLLCIVDEVLRGTNTIERIAASSEILADINRMGVICFAATHDIELSYMLEKQYENYHFEETITEEDVTFDYLLMKGRTNTRNAIRLLDIMGFDKKIVNNAGAAAADFENEGVWKTVRGGA